MFLIYSGESASIMIMKNEFRKYRMTLIKNKDKILYTYGKMNKQNNGMNELIVFVKNRGVRLFNIVNCIYVYF